MIFYMLPGMTHRQFWVKLREAFMFHLWFVRIPGTLLRERSTQNSHALNLALTSVSLPTLFLVVTFPKVWSLGSCFSAELLLSALV